MNKKHQPSQTICFCNSVTKDVIEKAIREGAITTDQIFDATNAGVGACGGSCRPDLKKMLDHYIQHGTFPDIPRRTKRRR